MNEKLNSQNLHSDAFYKVDIVIIGAGQAGLSAAYYLKKYGIKPGAGFVVLDDENGPGGAWRNRWDSLTLKTVNGLSDLPGMPLSESIDISDITIQANKAVPKYFGEYETKFELPIIRPLKVIEVYKRRKRFFVKTNGIQFSARGIINATGTWKNPNWPIYPGVEKFKGLQLHTKDYKRAEDFYNKHVIIIGGGISAVQMLGELSKITTTTWITRSPPVFSEEKFTEELGREAVAKVEERVRLGLPPQSVVSVTGLPNISAIDGLLKNGRLERMPMFDEITENGVRWNDGTELNADVIFWNTGFSHSLDHLESLKLKNDKNGITMSGKLATQVASDPSIHLTGYGPSASTIGANRAGRAVAREIIEFLKLMKSKTDADLK